MNNRLGIAQNVRNIRCRLKLSQEDLADLTNASVSTIRRIENADPSISAKKLYDVFKTLGINSYYSILWLDNDLDDNTYGRLMPYSDVDAHEALFGIRREHYDYHINGIIDFVHYAPLMEKSYFTDLINRIAPANTHDVYIFDAINRAYDDIKDKRMRTFVDGILDDLRNMNRSKSIQASRLSKESHELYIEYDELYSRFWLGRSRQDFI